MLSAIASTIRRAVVRRLRNSGRILISDTTLRDGEQMPGVRFSPADKVTIARALAEAGVHSLDAGFPAVSAEEVEAIRRIVREVRGPIVTALCRTMRADIDRAAEALADAWPHKKGVTLFIGVSPQHLEHKHQKKPAEALRQAVEAIQYARRFFHIVTFGPEDASRADPDFLVKIYAEAIAAGATTIGFADTVGILTPEQAADRIKLIQDRVSNISQALLAVHFHNDLGLATANALACVPLGIHIVQGTINGLGERAGNTPIEEVVMALHVHAAQYRRRCDVHPQKLYALCQLVARLAKVPIPPNKAVVASNMFRTESGIHQAGLLADASTYLPFLPEQIGGPPIQLVLGKHSGRHAVRHRFHACHLDLDDAQVDQVVDYLKRHPHRPMYVTDDDIVELYHEVFDAPEQSSPTTRLAAGG